MKEQMTVHKALAELKTLDARIQKEIDCSTFVIANKHSNSKIAGVPVKDFVEQAKEQYQSVRTLINRRNAIKRAVTRSNAMTMIKAGGQEYSVAEAIDMKNLGGFYLKMLLDKINTQASKAKMQADRENGEKLDQRTEQYIKNLYEGADMKNMSAEVQRMRDDFVTSQTVEVVDPIDYNKVTKSLQDQLDAFMTDIDSALSVSNAMTLVDVEYETA